MSLWLAVFLEREIPRARYNAIRDSEKLQSTYLSLVISSPRSTKIMIANVWMKAARAEEWNRWPRWFWNARKRRTIRVRQSPNECSGTDRWKADSALSHASCWMATFPMWCRRSLVYPCVVVLQVKAFLGKFSFHSMFPWRSTLRRSSQRLLSSSFSWPNPRRLLLYNFDFRLC